MNKLKEMPLKKMLTFACVLWILFAGTFLFMKPAAEGNLGRESTAVLILGLLFWILFILGLITSIVPTVKFHKMCREADMKFGGRPGVLNFFSNKVAIVVDILMILSLIACFLLFLFNVQNQYLYFVDFFFLAFTIPWHCIWNGTMAKAIRVDSEL